MIIKVFITLEREEKDKDIKSVVQHCLLLEEVLTSIGIPCQLKITSLPRRSGFRPASELMNIEKE